MPDESKTFMIKYEGARFEGARLPLDVLSDLPAFRDLLVSYAKDIWRRENVKKQRLPKGFDQSISLDLVGVAEGCAIAKIAWSRTAGQESLPGIYDEIEIIVDRSYNDIVRLIGDAGQQRYPRVLPAAHVRALNKLGAGLREDEKIVLPVRTPSNDNIDTVYLDAKRRRELIIQVSETYYVRYEDYGMLNGLHVGEGWVSVLTERYGQLKISVDPYRVGDEFDGNTGKPVQSRYK